MTQARSREDAIQKDVADLHKLGYAQELFRSMGGFSNFAISFSIISILTGAVILYDYGLAWAGTAAVLIGWPLITVFVLAIAASMAEIASAYPTAGGLYYWASRMKNKNWGWWTAWLNLIGQFAIVAGINFAAAAFLNATIVTPLLANVGIDYDNTTAVLGGLHQRADRDDGHPHARRARDEHRRHQPRGVAQPGQRLVAHRHRRGGRRPRLPRRQAGRIGADAVRRPAAGRRRGAGTTTSASSTSSTGRRSATRPSWRSSSRSSRPTGPTPVRRIGPRGRGDRRRARSPAPGASSCRWRSRRSSASSSCSRCRPTCPNLSTLFPATLRRPTRRPPASTTSAAASAVIDILEYNLGQLGDILSAGIAIAMAFCGLSSVASAGRMLYAFSRDDGLPGAGWLKKVSRRYRTPANALTASSWSSWLFTCAA